MCVPYQHTEQPLFQMESIIDGRRAGHGTVSSQPAPSQEQQQQQQQHPRGHRRRGSRVGHSRSESLAESLAEVLEVLMVIDEVEAAPQVNNHHSTSNNFPPSSNRRRVRGHPRAESLTEYFIEELKDVAEAFFVEELNEAGEGDTFLLEMSLARGMSIRPDDMMRVAEATASEVMQQTTRAAAGEEE
jgi:hypothetical protein